MSSYETLSLRVDSGVAILTIDRPERRNAFSWQMALDLAEVVANLEADRSLRVVVLTGRGKDFCVGADLAADKSTRTLRGISSEDDHSRLRVAADAAAVLANLRVPVVASISGACAGAGLSLALTADIRIAATTARFNTAFVSAGLSGDLGLGWHLTRLVGASRATRLLVLPERLDADQAQRAGLVDEVSDRPLERALILAERIRDSAPKAVSNAKANVRDAASMSLEEYLEKEIERMVSCAQSSDSKEAAQAFLDKRAPKFTGD